MAFENRISAHAFCVHHRIERSFLYSLQEQGLLHMHADGENEFLDADELPELEALLRLHQDLHINAEGLDVIRHLLHRIANLEQETARLRNKLAFYISTEP